MKIGKESGWLKKYGLLAFAFLAAACFLAIGSKSSPLYPMNNWDDVNCYFTIGRSLLHGKTLYVDVYDHKGPVLYFLFALIALVSEKSFIGLYFVEILSFGTFLYLSGKCASLYLNRIYSFGVILALAVSIPLSQAFSHGGNVEQLCLGPLMYSLYSVLKAVKEQKILSFGCAFLNGVFAACVLWSKYTILGFYAGLALFVIFWYVARGKGRHLFKTILHFLLGCLCVTAVVLVYFLVHHAVKDLFEVYFYNNIFVYADVNMAFWQAISKGLLDALCSNLIFSVFVAIGLVWFLFRARRNWAESAAVWLTFAGLTVSTYCTGRYFLYYALSLSVFAPFGLIALMRIFDFALKKMGLRLPAAMKNRPIRLLGLAVAFAGCLTLLYQNSNNVPFMKYSRDELPQYQFAKEINKVENATMLNYGFLDGGFYNAAGVIPNCEFFCRMNLEIPEMYYAQIDYVGYCEVDFVVTRGKRLEEYELYSAGYQCVDTAEFQGVSYYLYKRI